MPFGILFVYARFVGPWNLFRPVRIALMETATTDLASDDSVTANAAWAGPPVLCPSDHFFCGTFVLRCSSQLRFFSCPYQTHDRKFT
ncbi:hypothetical protein BHM03_00051445 [Ensete ventricosum]|nr:hypothetical protein BHM03_00051445 [Ensete ventricosum]